MSAKKYIGPFFLILLFSSAQAQNMWTQKADFGGTARGIAVGFSIGSKGYIGTGAATDGFKKDFWEFDTTTNAWTQKANLGGAARYAAVGFSIGSKGYIGTGADGYNNFNDFWEYDPATNIWTQKADFGGKKRYHAVGFSIGGKGYIGTGNNGICCGGFKDFWEYDPVTNAWTEKADFGGGERVDATGFSISSKGYIGTGVNSIYPYNKKDFWEYDPVTNSWIQKADFGGGERVLAVSFSIGSKGYVGTGSDSLMNFKNDFWEYDPAANAWTQKADFGGIARYQAVGFSIGSKGFIGTGGDNLVVIKDFWEYSPALTCDIPTGEYANDITSNTATLNWNLVDGAEGYKIRYKISGISEWTKRTTSKDHKKITGLSLGTEYIWEVKTYCTIAPNLTSDWSEKQYFTTLPVRLGNEEAIASLQVFPNPFSTSTTISFSLAENSQVTIELLDLAGRKIETVLHGNLEFGINSVQLSRDQLDAGIYLLRIKANEETSAVKIVIE